MAETDAGEYISQLQSIRIQKRPLQHRPRYLKADEPVITLRCVMALRHLEYIKSQLRLDV